MNYTILLNHRIKKYILEQSPDERNRFFQKFEYLETGYWDGGLKVKKLKGQSAKVVLEGRVDRGRRILFTLGKEEDRPDLILIYIWGIVVHDDISSKARAIIPDNAPFLSFEEVDSTPSVEMEFSQLPYDWVTQPSINLPMEQEHGPQQWFCVSENEWRRMALYQQGDFELQLYLTNEQKRYLTHPLPFLMAGTAGSGKTTIAVYNLFRREFITSRKLFITCNQYLKDYSQQIYNGLLNHAPESDIPYPPDFMTFHEMCLKFLDPVEKECFSDDKKIDNLKFYCIYQRHRFSNRFDWQLIWEEIRAVLKGKKLLLNHQAFYQSITAIKSGYAHVKYFQQIKDTLEIIRNSHLNQPVNDLLAGQFVNLDSFIAGFESHCADRPKPALHHLQKIHEILLKNHHDFSSPMMSYAEYNALGMKTAPNFPFNRREIYDIAEYYQNRLTDENQWDELDLVRSALLKLDVGRREDLQWEIVIADEVQDFTDLQLQLIFKLPRDPRQMLFAGDIKQTINPSGFRWETIKQYFYQHRIETPEIQKLSINFRNTGEIVKLANALLDLKRRVSMLHRYEYKEQWRFSGIPPKLLVGIDFSSIRTILHHTAVKQTIITRDQAEKNKLQKLLNTKLVFTINEAKGLEFDTVFLYNFCTDRNTNRIWQTILNGTEATRHQALIDYEINLLYVAITRSRNNLIIWDEGEISPVWQVPELSHLVVHAMTSRDFELLWQANSSPEEWKQYGDYMMERRFFLQAAECFHNAGLEYEEKIARINYLESIENEGELYDLYYEIGDYAKAAAGFEKLTRWDDAVQAYQSAGIPQSALNAQAHLLMIRNQYEEAAQIWESLKSFNQALSAWKKSSNKLKCAELAWKLKNYDESATYYESIRQYSQALKAWKKTDNHLKIVEMLIKTGQIKPAIRLASKHRITDRIHKFLIDRKEYYFLALLLDQQHDPKCKKFFTMAIDLNQIKLQDLASEGHRLMAKQHFSLAAISFSRAELWMEAAKCYLKANDPNQAVQCYLNAGQLIKAAQILESQQNYLEAAFCYAEANTDHPTVPDKHFEWCVNKGLNILKDKGDTIIDDKIDHYMIEGLYHAALHFGIYYCDYELNKECIRHLSSIPDDDYPVLALTGQFDRMLRKAVDENTPSAFSQAIDLIDNQQSRRNDPEKEFILLKLRLLLQRLTDDDQFDFNVKCLISNLLDSHLKLIGYFKPVIELLHQTNAWKYLFLYFSHFHAFRKPDEMESICNPLIDKFLQENQYVPAFFTALISRDKDAIIQSSRDKEGLRTIIECYDKIRNGEPLTIAFEVWKEHQLLPEIIKEAEMVESYHLLGCISEYLKDYRSAGQYFIQAECYYNAQQCFRHIPGPHLETALCYDKLSQPARALKLYAQMQAWDQFIELYHRLPEKSRRTQSIQNVLSSILKQDHYPDKIAVLLPTSHDVVQKKLQFDEPTAGHDQQ